MADLLAMSSAVIDGTRSADDVGPMNRINHQLSTLVDGVAMVEAFSHCILFETADGLLAFDTSGPGGGSRVVEAVRGWRTDRFDTIVYTHGHIDHVGGCGAFIEDAEASGAPRPRVVGHANVPARFDRYDLTNGYNLVINERQFGQFRRRGYDMTAGARFLPRPRRNRTSPTTTCCPSRRRPGGGAAPRQRRDGRPHLGVDPAAPRHLRRRLLHLELPERRQPAEGSALPR